MVNFICKIYKNEEKGTGFIYKITGIVYSLITNNHILNENDRREKDDRYKYKLRKYKHNNGQK